MHTSLLICPTQHSISLPGQNSGCPALGFRHLWNFFLASSIHLSFYGSFSHTWCYCVQLRWSVGLYSRAETTLPRNKCCDPASPGFSLCWDSSCPCSACCAANHVGVRSERWLCLFRSPWWSIGSSRERTNEGICWPARGTSDWAAGLWSIFSSDHWPGSGDSEWPKGTCSLLLVGCRLSVQLAAGSWGRWGPFWRWEHVNKPYTGRIVPFVARNESGTRVNIRGYPCRLVP